MQGFIRSKKRYFFSLCSFVSLAVCLLASCAGAPKHPTWSNATGAEQHERLMWRAIRDKDWSNFERHLSATFVGVNADGQMFDRRGWLAYWKNAQAGESSLGELSVQPEGPDMKVTYTLRVQGVASKNADPDAGLRVVSVWQQVKTRWVLATTSLTPIQKQN